MDLIIKSTQFFTSSIKIVMNNPENTSEPYNISVRNREAVRIHRKLRVDIA